MPAVIRPARNDEGRADVSAGELGETPMNKALLAIALIGAAPLAAPASAQTTTVVPGATVPAGPPAAVPGAPVDLGPGDEVVVREYIIRRRAAPVVVESATVRPGSVIPQDVELEPFDVRVRLVLPGRSPETPFGQNAQARMRAQGVTVPEAYADFARSVFERRTGQGSAPVTRSLDVAEAVWRAVSDPASPIRLPAGADALELAGAN